MSFHSARHCRLVNNNSSNQSQYLLRLCDAEAAAHLEAEQQKTRPSVHCRNTRQKFRDTSQVACVLYTPDDPIVPSRILHPTRPARACQIWPSLSIVDVWAPDGLLFGVVFSSLDPPRLSFFFSLFFFESPYFKVLLSSLSSFLLRTQITQASRSAAFYFLSSGSSFISRVYFLFSLRTPLFSGTPSFFLHLINFHSERKT